MFDYLQVTLHSQNDFYAQVFSSTYFYINVSIFFIAEPDIHMDDIIF